MAGAIFVTILAVLVIWTICCSSGDSTNNNNNTVQKRNVSTARETRYYEPGDYCECPSCGAPFFVGYCEECGYPDVNQGWLGDEYG